MAGMTIRRWMLSLGIIVFMTLVGTFVYSLAARGECSYDYPCSENPPGCTNPDGCLGGDACKCDVEKGRCVPA
jgi:hypothetical protein